ncbi:unnamed protein product [Bursaphelenchus okinawaensis]|uniref:Uncharacterized protein n=1 Tax=Bursaphelenchus okinawaensis TaxID=465554 RepID=A0A811LPU8_9BILA|nr:unnamed protein product [Bursaphelenchus okinawaensis]CAG9127182.1 unnamed protein product [Bursaphelenchus okinawaensis]
MEIDFIMTFLSLVSGAISCTIMLWFQCGKNDRTMVKPGTRAKSTNNGAAANPFAASDGPSTTSTKRIKGHSLKDTDDMSMKGNIGRNRSHDSSHDQTPGAALKDILRSMNSTRRSKLSKSSDGAEKTQEPSDASAKSRKPKMSKEEVDKKEWENFKKLNTSDKGSHKSNKIKKKKKSPAKKHEKSSSPATSKSPSKEKIASPSEPKNKKVSPKEPNKEVKKEKKGHSKDEEWENFKKLDHNDKGVHKSPTKKKKEATGSGEKLDESLKTASSKLAVKPVVEVNEPPKEMKVGSDESTNKVNLNEANKEPQEPKKKNETPNEPVNEEKTFEKEKKITANQEVKSPLEVTANEWTKEENTPEKEKKTTPNEEVKPTEEEKKETPNEPNEEVKKPEKIGPNESTNDAKSTTMEPQREVANLEWENFKKLNERTKESKGKKSKKKSGVSPAKKLEESLQSQTTAEKSGVKGVDLSTKKKKVSTAEATQITKETTVEVK